MKKSPLDFCSISDRSMSSGGTLLPWVSIKALASLGAVKPTLGSKVPPLETLLPEMEKNLRDFSFPMMERDILKYLLFTLSGRYVARSSLYKVSGLLPQTFYHIFDWKGGWKKLDERRTLTIRWIFHKIFRRFIPTQYNHLNFKKNC